MFRQLSSSIQIIPPCPQRPKRAPTTCGQNFMPQNSTLAIPSSPVVYSRLRRSTSGLSRPLFRLGHPAGRFPTSRPAHLQTPCLSRARRSPGWVRVWDRGSRRLLAKRRLFPRESLPDYRISLTVTGPRWQWEAPDWGGLCRFASRRRPVLTSPTPRSCHNWLPRESNWRYPYVVDLVCSSALIGKLRMSPERARPWLAESRAFPTLVGARIRAG